MSPRKWGYLLWTVQARIAELEEELEAERATRSKVNWLLTPDRNVLLSQPALTTPEPPDRGGTGVKGPHWQWKAFNVGVKDRSHQKGLDKGAHKDEVVEGDD